MRGARKPGSTPRRWSAQVALRPPALDLDAGLFTWSDPEQIAASLLRSAHRSRRRKRSAYASAMAMLCLYINSSFSPAPVQKLADLADCFAVDGELLVNYSLTPAFG